MPIIIRQAIAKDAHIAAPLILSSGPDVFAFLFNHSNKNCADFVKRCLKSNKGLFGYQAHVVAEIDGKVVGAASIYNQQQHKHWSNQMMPLLIKYYRWRVPFMVPKLLRSSKWMVPPQKNELYLANFGVAADYRGQGIGEKMLEYGLKMAQQQNKKLYSLDVSHDNPHAERLYRRFGMHEVTNRVFPKADGKVADCRRLSMPVKY